MPVWIKILVLLVGVTVTGAKAAEPDYRPAALTREIKNITGSGDAAFEPLGIRHSSGNAPFGKFFKIRTDASTLKYAYVGRVTSCRAGGCGIQPEVPADGLSEYFDYFILFDATGAVMTVRVYNYQATHGQEITVRGWLKQFIGFKANQELRVGKEVDSITGATISVYAITDDIREKTTLLQSNIPR